MSETPSRFSTWFWNAIMLVFAIVVVVTFFELRLQRGGFASIGGVRAASVTPLDVGDEIAGGKLLALGGPAKTDLRDIARDLSVITFLTTTCPYCKLSQPNWSALADELADRGIPFASISLHGSGATNAYAQEYHIDWPIWVAEDPGELMTATGIRTVPLAVIASDGRILKIYRGQFVDAYLEDLLHDLDTILKQ